MKDINSTTTRDVLGLCLSGGAALGYAHIGAIQALEDHGIIPDEIAGSSMGAIVGTIYAAGYSPADMLQMIKDDKLYKITKLMNFQPTFLKSGLANHDILRSLIHELIPHNSFEELKKRMYICVVNLTEAKWEIISQGNELDKWLAASASIPGVFEAVNQTDIFYVDGGLLNNFPSQSLVKNCQTIIGIDVNPHIAPLKLKKPFETLVSSVRVAIHENSKAGRDLCRYLIEPRAIEKHNEFSFDAYMDIYHEGYRATTKYIVDNPDMMIFSKKRKK